MKSFEICFKDLTVPAQTEFCETFRTSPREERDNVAPLAVIEREDENPAIYLGLGVHAVSYDSGVVLRIGDNENINGEIYLASKALENLNIFANQQRHLAEKEDERKEPENLANTNDTKEG